MSIPKRNGSTKLIILQLSFMQVKLISLSRKYKLIKGMDYDQAVYVRDGRQRSAISKW